MYITVGNFLLLKNLLLVGVDALACYGFITFLLPKIKSRKWWKALKLTIIMCMVLFVAAYITYWYIFNFIDFLFGQEQSRNIPTRFWPAIYLGFVNPIKVVAAAVAIKYVNNWWLKRRESEKLEKQKIDTEFQLLKAQIHPEFLFHSLDSIHNLAVGSSDQTSDLLLRLSDLLSYMLYECDGATVSLEKEIAMMKEYMLFERTRIGEKLDMEVSIKGSFPHHEIAAFILFPFIQNSFRFCSTSQHPWINVDILIEENCFSMKLANGIEDDVNVEEVLLESDFEKVQKRLTFLYPQQHQVKVVTEQGMLLVMLKIQLSELVPQSGSNDVSISIVKGNAYVLQ